MAPPRRPLHQRSDSDANARQFLPPNEDSATVSQKSSDAASFPSRTASTNSTKTSKSKRHKSQNSGSTTGTGTVSRSNGTVRSERSLESLPPVPPLRIAKRRTSSFEGDIQGRHSATSNIYAPGTAYDTPKYVDDEIQNPRPCTPPSLPRSILKKASRSTLPPFDENDYQQKSSIWVASQTIDYTPNRARMNAQTLRLINTSGESLEGRSTAGDRSSGAEEEEDIEVGESAAQGQLRFEHNASLARSPDASESANPTIRPVTPVQPSAYPAWARYFYGKVGGRTSIIIPDPSDNRIVAMSRPEPRPGTSGTMSISEIPRFLLGGRREPDTQTLWSLPHLDHTPPSRIERFDRQLLLFCFGFLLPICWWVAAFLPLPPKLPSWAPDLEARGYDFPISKEARQVETAYEHRYENARWWRRVNRVLSVVGVLVVAAIIALAVVSSRNS